MSSSFSAINFSPSSLPYLYAFCFEKIAGRFDEDDKDTLNDSTYDLFDDDEGCS